MDYDNAGDDDAADDDDDDASSHPPSPGWHEKLSKGDICQRMRSL